MFTSKAILIAAIVLASVSAASAQSYGYRVYANDLSYDSHYRPNSSSWDGASRGSFGGY